MKYLNDPIGNPTRDLVACSAMPQPTSPSRLFVYFFDKQNLKDTYHPLYLLQIIFKQEVWC
jgi:hypothetical protein